MQKSNEGTGPLPREAQGTPATGGGNDGSVSGFHCGGLVGGGAPLPLVGEAGHTSYALAAAAPVATAQDDVAWSTDDESFPYDSLDEAIDSLRDCDVEDPIGRTVYFGAKVPCDPTRWCDAADIVDLLMNRAYDEVGEAAEDWPPLVSDTAQAELSEFLGAWITKHCPANFWLIPNSRPYTITAEDVSAAASGSAA